MCGHQWKVIYWLLLVIYWPYFLIYWFLLLLAPLRRKQNLPGLMGNPVATHCWEHGHASLGFSQRKYFVYQHRMYIPFLDFFKRNMWTAMKDHTLARSLTSTSPNNLVGEPAWPPPTQRGHIIPSLLRINHQITKHTIEKLRKYSWSLLFPE